MLENKWNNIAPEVPQDFHDKFEETLRQIEQADPVDKKYKRKRISGRLLIAAAVICTGMAVTVAAKEFFKWNDYLVKRLDPSEEQQEHCRNQLYSEYRPVCNTKWCDGYPDRFCSGSGISVCFF